MTGSIRAKLTATYLLVIAVFMAALGVNLPFLIERRYIQSVSEELRAHAKPFLAGFAELLNHPTNPNDLEKLCREAAGYLGVGVAVLDRRGRILSEAAPRLDSPPQIPQVSPTKKACRFCHSPSAPLHTQSVVELPIQSGGRTTGLLRLIPQAGPIRRVSDTVRKATFIVSLAAAVLAGLVSFGIASTISHPVVEMSRMADQMARGNLHARIEVASNDEIGQLANSLNNMAETLERMVTQLAAEKERRSAVLMGMADGILAVNRRGEVILFNRAAAEMLGTKLNGIEGLHISKIPFVRSFWPLLRQSMETNTPTNLQVTIKTPSYRALSIKVCPLQGASEEDCGAMAVFHDLTELRRSEEARRRFLADVSHEMRTPVAAIKGAVEVLNSGAIDDPPARERFMAALEREADRLSALLDDLLDLELIDAGKLVLRPEPVHVRSLVEQAVEELQQRIADKRLAVTIQIPEHIHMVADAIRMAQVLGNLLDNAVKYTPEGGSIRISAWQEGDSVYLSVADTGVGIPEEDLPHVFERFYRADKARSRRLGGTGLGLAIVREIVAAHGGRVSVTSSVGQGSTFTVEVPVAGATSRPE
ncbi:MAG: ATP-binding protein [Armatimonadota bacterium]